MKAKQLEQVDEEHKMHKQAWLNYQVQATKQKGKKTVPVFKTFKEFFDYEKHINAVTKPKEKKRSKVELLLLKANS